MAKISKEIKITRFESSEAEVSIRDADWLSDQMTLLEIRFGHVGRNRKKIDITREAWVDAFDKFAYRPVLANIKKYKRDVGEHDYKFIGYDENGKRVNEYFEKQVGSILSTKENNIHFEYNEELEIEQVVGYAVIPKEYNYHLLEILKDNPIKKVSIELFIVDGYEDKDGYEVVTKFEPYGITILGEEYQEGMFGSNLEVIKFIGDRHEQVNQAVCFALNESKLVDISLEDFSDSDFHKNVSHIEKKSKGLSAKKKFVRGEAMTNENKFKMLSAIIFEMGSFVVHDEYDDYSYELCKYYLRDFDDTNAYVTSHEDGKNYKFDYSVDEEENYTIDVDSKVEVVVLYEYKSIEESGLTGEELEKEAILNKEVLEFSTKPVREAFIAKIEAVKHEAKTKEAGLKAEFVDKEIELKKEFSEKAELEKVELEEKIEAMSDYEELKGFKSDFVKQEKENFVESFAKEYKEVFSKDDIETFKEKTKEMDIESLKKEMKVFAFDKSDLAEKLNTNAQFVYVPSQEDILVGKEGSKSKGTLWERI